MPSNLAPIVGDFVVRERTREREKEKREKEKERDFGVDEDIGNLGGTRKAR